VIVLTMEMAKEKIGMAPSGDTQVMVFQTYDRLGKAINKLTDYIRANGYAAQTGYPLGGLILYPAIAQLAGLSWHGRHGLLITPEFGSRQRIGVIYTSIRNLPFAHENQHAWINRLGGYRFCTSSAMSNGLTQRFKSRQGIGTKKFFKNGYGHRRDELIYT
jgi:epoxyqueuosine reductase